MFMYFVYILKNDFNNIYIGITTDVEKRLATHNSNRGALFTKRSIRLRSGQRNKFSIVFTEEYPTLALARKREIQIKKWRRDKKEILIEKFQNGLETKI